MFSLLQSFCNSLQVDLILKMLDLKHVENTLVGNDLIRGISGGQRKRLTIGVSVTGCPQLGLLV